MRAVLDANVLVSALIRPEGPPGRVLVRLIRDGAFELVASPATLEEVRRSLRYPRIRKYLPLREQELDSWVGALAAVALVVEGKVSRHVVLADPADDIYIPAAADGLADYIVSGDCHQLDLGEHEGIRIVKLRTFLSLMEH